MSSLAIIGAGNMGYAIMRGVIEAGIVRADEILAVEVDESRRQRASSLGCQVSEIPSDAAQAERILLAVKPQSFSSVAATIGTLPRSALVVSIMAGVSSSAIRRALGHNARVIRAMPNTASMVRQGMTALARGEGATDADEQAAAAMFSALGRIVMVEESLLHAVTAVSASGLAYVFLLAEAMQRAGESLGLEPATSKLLVDQTIAGAGAMLLQSGQTAAELRAAVTSRGGTTEAAVKIMQARQLPEIVLEALTAARDRAAELGHS